jgi:hypothetical protein
LAFGNFKKKLCEDNQVGGTSISTILILLWKKWNGRQHQILIHDVAWWAPYLEDVILFFEDPCKKQLVGLLCSIKELDNALTSTNAKKGFEVRSTKLRTLTLRLSLKNGLNSRSSLYWKRKTP